MRENSPSCHAIPLPTGIIRIGWRFQKVHVYRRIDSGFDREIYTGLDAIIPLPEIKCELALPELYQNVQFAPAISDDES